MIAFARSALSLSNTGSPRPTGQFSTQTPSLAPTELPSAVVTEVSFVQQHQMHQPVPYLTAYPFFKIPINIEATSEVLTYSSVVLMSFVL